MIYSMVSLHGHFTFTCFKNASFFNLSLIMYFWRLQVRDVFYLELNDESHHFIQSPQKVNQNF